MPDVAEARGDCFLHLLGARTLLGAPGLTTSNMLSCFSLGSRGKPLRDRCAPGAVGLPKSAMERRIRDGKDADTHYEEDNERPGISRDGRVSDFFGVPFFNFFSRDDAASLAHFFCMAF